MKRQGRKPPKRRQPVANPSELNADLLELAQALVSRPEPATPEAMFAIPWRDGWNAAELAFDCYVRVQDYDKPSGAKVDGEITAAMSTWVRQRYSTPRIHEVAGDYLGELAVQAILHTMPAVRMLMCGLRCVQLTLSNSHGGGSTFNDLFVRVFDQAPYGVDVVESQIRELRCLDAIGVRDMLENDINDHLRRAFRIAWDNGYYRAAYALPKALNL